MNKLTPYQILWLRGRPNWVPSDDEMYALYDAEYALDWSNQRGSPPPLTKTNIFREVISYVIRSDDAQGFAECSKGGQTTAECACFKKIRKIEAQIARLEMTKDNLKRHLRQGNKQTKKPSTKAVKPGRPSRADEERIFLAACTKFWARLILDAFAVKTASELTNLPSAAAAALPNQPAWDRYLKGKTIPQKATIRSIRDCLKVAHKRKQISQTSVLYDIAAIDHIFCDGDGWEYALQLRDLNESHAPSIDR
ncbi:MAG: hypothetical protein LW865_02445 [Betaproteobacteria bacterium]|jgi:hypothetical protein|nr:hypothetical protein [Betaproteobacteria bacterium]